MFEMIGWSKIRIGGWEYEKLARDEGVFSFIWEQGDLEPCWQWEW